MAESLDMKVEEPLKMEVEEACKSEAVTRPPKESIANNVEVADPALCFCTWNALPVWLERSIRVRLTEFVEVAPMVATELIVGVVVPNPYWVFVSSMESSEAEETAVEPV